MSDETDYQGLKPYRIAQVRYEKSARGREVARQKQARYRAQRKASLEEVAELRREVAELRKRAGSDLGLTKSNSNADIAALLWSMIGQGRALKVADLIVRRAHPTKTLAALLKDQE